MQFRLLLARYVFVSHFPSTPPPRCFSFFLCLVAIDCSYDTIALGVILSIMNAALVALAAFQVRRYCDRSP